ncbi:MAG TPA: acyltransferase [Opitutaceae bacterium]|nr:acyltransferase [Opitutaceae bacterium]
MPGIEIRIPPNQDSRLSVLDELKGIAILLIVLYHAGGVLLWRNFLHGDIGVDIFFLLSGLGLALSRRQESFGSFMSRRLIRLFPAYWLVLVIFLICNTHFLRLHYSAFNIAIHVVGLHGLFGDFYAFAIDDSFWFITPILLLYPCCYFLKPKLETLDVFLLFTALISVVGAFAFFFTNQGGSMGHIGFRLPGFFVGMMIGHLIRTGRIQFPMTAFLGVALFVLVYVPYTQGITFYSIVVTFAVIAAYLWALRRKLGENSRIPSALNWVGRHSFEIFLIHQPLLREYNFYLHGRWLNVPLPSEFSRIVGMTIAFAVTLLLAAELRKLQEKFIRV